jgi:hypothetical protein
LHPLGLRERQVVRIQAEPEEPPPDENEAVAAIRALIAAGRLTSAKRRSAFAPSPNPALVGRDKAGLGIFWLKDERLEASANLPDPSVLTGEIVQNLQAALEEFRSICEECGGE